MATETEGRGHRKEAVRKGEHQLLHANSAQILADFWAEHAWGRLRAV